MKVLKWPKRAAAAVRTVWNPVLMMVFMMVSVFALSGCSQIRQGEEIRKEEMYTLPQVMTIAATERNRYQKVYTSQIWEAVTDENGTTMKDMLLSQIRTFLEDLETMNRLAESREIIISGAEQDQIQKLADVYYEGLTEGDLDYIQVSKQEVERLYEKYYMANKLVNELTKDVDLEISDSEAKVIDLQQIVLDSLETANQVYSQATAENADFEAIAKANTVSEEMKRSLGRGQETANYEEAAFALEEGQISAPVESDGKYYIIKCIDSYNEEETAKRKSELSLARKDQAFRSIYDEFRKTNPVTLPDSLWNQVSFEGGEECTTANFFDLYQEHFQK